MNLKVASKHVVFFDNFEDLSILKVECRLKSRRLVILALSLGRHWPLNVRNSVATFAGGIYIMFNLVSLYLNHKNYKNRVYLD